jgi:hypothetical protein
MLKPEVIDAMVAAGCSVEQMAAAVKASMGRSLEAARQAAYREREKEQGKLKRLIVT